MNLNKQKRTVDLERLAIEARTDSQGATATQPVATPATANDRLQKLLNNVGKTVILPTNFLTIHDNVRQILDVSGVEFRQLVDSVKQHGVKQNLIGDLRVAEDGQWKIIVVTGQRRLLAAKEAGLETVPVRLEQYAGETALLVDSLSENILRQNLHCLDAALGYLKLMHQGWSADDIATAFERKRDTVMKMLRLARYPQAAQRIICQYPEKFTSTILLTRFVAKSWPNDQALIAALEGFATENRKRSLRATITHYEVKEIETTISDRGVRAKSKGSPESGQLVLAWNSPDEFFELKRLFSIFPAN